jgi:hypothetical protein
MSDNQAANKKEKDWKEYLLKSSLPLEQIVSKKLENKQMGIVGEYPYIRPNEQGIHTEFSIDLHAVKFLGTQLQSVPIDLKKYTARLNLLIECKYNHPGVRWIFSPYPPNFEMPLTVFRLQKMGKHSTFSLDLDTEPFLPFCTRGIELHGTGFDPNNISRGLSQLRYGMPNLILQEIDRLKPSNRLFFTEQSLIGLMLVTTADLYVLRADQDIEAYRSAESLEDVAQKVDALVVSQERGPHLQQYCEELCETRFNRKPSDHVEQQLIKKEVNEDFPMEFQIIVVGLNSLEDVIDLIVDAIKNNSQLMQVAEIE